MSGERLKILNIKELLGGAEGIRTPDLCSAIAALSHLSYSPLAAALYVRVPALSTAPEPQEKLCFR